MTRTPSWRKTGFPDAGHLVDARQLGVRLLYDHMRRSPGFSHSKIMSISSISMKYSPLVSNVPKTRGGGIFHNCLKVSLMRDLDVPKTRGGGIFHKGGGGIFHRNRTDSRYFL